LIFARYSAGERMMDIARSLNGAEVLTRRGCAWTKWSISHLLHNPAYAGFRRWDGFLVPSTHDPIISQEQFNSVQTTICAKVKDPRHRHIVELASGTSQVSIPA